MGFFHTWVRISPPTEPGLRSASDVQADFAEVFVRLLVPEGVNDIFKGKVAIDDRFHSIGFNGADHVDLMLTAANQHTLQSQVANDGGDN